MMILIRYLGIGFTIVCVLASMAMNYKFIYGWGNTPIEGQIFGGLSVAFDGFKSVLPVLIGLAIASREFVKATVGSVIFTLLVIFAIAAAMGFVSSNRGAMTGGKAANNDILVTKVQQERRLSERLKQISTKRSSAAIKADIRSKEQDRRHRSTKGCTDTTAPASVVHCKEYFALKAELANAVSRDRLLTKQDKILEEIAMLKKKGAGQAADKQAATITHFLPFLTVEDVQSGLAALLAMIVELIASFGLWLATNQSLAPARKRMRETADALAAEQEVQNVVFEEPVEVKKEKPILHIVHKDSRPERFSPADADLLLTSGKT